MTRSPLKLLIILILIFGSLVFFNKQFFNNKISFDFVPKFGQDAAAATFSKLAKTREIISSLKTISMLTNKNIELEQENLKLLSRLAETNNIALENEFLKKALKISNETRWDIKEASIYAWDFGPDGYTVLLNKGSNDGISEGDIIISDEKVLIGTVKEVGKNYSKVLVVVDPQFRVVARVLDSNTTGIATGALSGKMSFDLIIRDDEIHEGDVVVSSGNDIFPAALVIGKISKAIFSEAQLFQEVTIRPAIDDIVWGRVIILKHL